MSFKAFENASLMAEGEYEVTCVKCEECVTRTTNKPVIKFDFVVRSDIPQAYQRKHIFKNFFQNIAGEWPLDKIGKYANSLGIDKDADFELSDLIGRDCIVSITHYTGTDGEESECIYFTAPSKVPRISDDDMPL